MGQLLGLTSSMPTFGALDLGGASTQITFIPKTPSDMLPDFHEDLMLYGQPYKVYTYSYLCYGINEARRQLLAHLVTVSKTTIIIKFISRKY